MNITSNNSGNSYMSKAVPILIFTVGLIVLYYIYLYLYGSTTGKIYPLMATSRTAKTDPTTPIIIPADKLPILYEGGEFSISTWIYINDWSYRKGLNKCILYIGGSGGDMMRMYLGGNKPKLFIRFNTYESGSTPSQNVQTATQGSVQGATQAYSTTVTAQSDNLSISTRDSTFTNPIIDDGLLESSTICDLPEVSLQRWMNITIAANGKTVDVYLDGKLSRSCVLPIPFKVPNACGAVLLSHGGFGGEISTTSMYDIALNPEIVYKNYMAGHEPSSSIYDWFVSTFIPGINVSVSMS